MTKICLAMKNFFYLIFTFCLLIFTFSCCTNKPKHSRKPVSSIKIEPQKSHYSYGDKVTIKITTKLKNGQLKNSQLYFGNQLIKETTETSFSVENIELNQIGIQSVKVVSTKNDGVKNTNNKRITIVSDIQAEQYTYKIFNTYNHNKKSYTQGLEFYQGFLYEGTGEYGSSGIYKTNYKTGKFLQSKKINNKLFGEGITILNDKIYQLTYKAQKAFVYNLKTFAVIDSFRYQSKEGWGLTNDGKNLIMSDGTHKLYWINPTNFEVVKTIQVSNNKGIVNYINELEYIDEAIYANIYTTNVIVKIDAATGKVLQEINMSGLLNNQINIDDVDYLNGIAYDKNNKKMVVTGKLWPKLFEIEFIPVAISN